MDRLDMGEGIGAPLSGVGLASEGEGGAASLGFSGEVLVNAEGGSR